MGSGSRERRVILCVHVWKFFYILSRHTLLAHIHGFIFIGVELLGSRIYNICHTVIFCSSSCSLEMCFTLLQKFSIGCEFLPDYPQMAENILNGEPTLNELCQTAFNFNVSFFELVF